MIKNKCALITGASSGIGKNIAISLANEDITVCINYLKSDKAAQQVKKTIENNGGKAVFFKADISNEKAVKKMFAFVAKEF